MGSVAPICSSTVARTSFSFNQSHLRQPLKTKNLWANNSKIACNRHNEQYPTGGVMKKAFFVIAIAILLSACVLPTPTPTAHPPTVTASRPPTITPLPPSPITPTAVVSPTITPIPMTIITDALRNPDFERPYFSVGQSVTLPDQWRFGWTQDACDPDNPGCPFVCPSNCLNAHSPGHCLNWDCFWMKPEAAEAWYQDYEGLRVHTGKPSIKQFNYGRKGEWWLYQQVN